MNTSDACSLGIQRSAFDKTVADRLLLVEMRPNTVGNTSGCQQFKYKTVLTKQVERKADEQWHSARQSGKKSPHALFTKYRKVHKY